MPIEKTSSVQLPGGESVDIVLVRMPDGRLMPRRADELIKRPTPPASVPDAQNR
jgi:hypothetical protein